MLVYYNHRINNQPEVRLRVGAFDVGVLTHVASRISSSPSIRRLASSPGSFYRRVFFLHIGPYKYKTSAFVTGKCRLKVKSAGENCQDGVNMASKWRIDGVFWTCALKKRGQVFTRVGLLVNFIL